MLDIWSTYGEPSLYLITIIITCLVVCNTRTLTKLFRDRVTNGAIGQFVQNYERGRLNRKRRRGNVIQYQAIVVRR